MSHTYHSEGECRTRWGIVAVVVLAGIVAALQIGKAAIAAPLIRDDLALDLAALGWVVGIFGILGLVGGIPAGAVVARVGDRRMLILGLLGIAAGSFLGAVSSGYPMLLASRVGEGLGFLMVVVAGPTILNRVVSGSDRNIAFACWSCFMPTGMAVAMLAGPFIGDWHWIWWICGGTALLMSLVILRMVDDAAPALPKPMAALLEDVGRTLSRSGPLALGLLFSLYSLMFFAVFSFLPVLLMDRMGLPYLEAGLLSTLATVFNIIGNLSGGVLLSRGVGRIRLVTGALVVMGVTGFGIFSTLLGDVPTFLLCLLFSVVGGMIPATLMSTAPMVAPSAAMTPIVIGLLMQGSNLGQMVGPVSIGTAIDYSGWPAAGGVVAVAGILGLVLAMLLHRALIRQR